MRILVLNPNTSAEMTEDIARVARGAAATGTEIDCLAPAHGPETIESACDETIAALHALELLAGQREGYDAYVIACFGDPAVAACRELVDAPVVGIAEASFHLASLIAERWSVLTLLPRLRPLLEDNIARLGLSRRCASVRALSVGVAAGTQSFDGLLEQAREALARDRAEAIVLGCAGLGPLAAQMQEELGAPVLDAVACGVALAQALAGLGISTAKANVFAAPRAKPVPGAPPSLARVYGAQA